MLKRVSFVQWCVRRVFVWTLYLLKARRSWATEARWGKVVRFGDKWEFTIVARDLKKANRYTREELLEMLTIIRREERCSGWIVPEPVFGKGRVLVGEEDSPAVPPQKPSV